MLTETSQSTSTATPPLKAIKFVSLPRPDAEVVSTWASVTSVTNAHFLSMALEYFETGEPMKIKRFSIKPQNTVKVIRLPLDAGLRLARLASEQLFSPTSICRQAIAKVNDSKPSELFGKEWKRYASHLPRP